MGNLVFQATLGGQVNLVGPNTASAFNLNVPAVAGTLVTTGDTGTVTNTMLSGPVSIANGGTNATTAVNALTNLGAQATLVSGTNIKTINSTSILGSGNLSVVATPGGATTQVQYNSAGAFAGSANLTFDGTNLACGGTVSASSDETLKTNWRGYSSDFVKNLASIKHGTYDRIDVDLIQDGVSAQSLQKLLPHSVIQGENGKLSVAYGNAALVCAVELAKKVNNLENVMQQLLSSLQNHKE